MPHFEPTDESFMALLARDITGPLLMLNLLRFRAVADYSASPELAPEVEISGRAAYEHYITHTEPFLRAGGGSIRMLADGGNYVIGPPDERWDLLMVIEQASVQSFLDFATDEAYLAGAGHRRAALEDSRILPAVEWADRP